MKAYWTLAILAMTIAAGPAAGDRLLAAGNFDAAASAYGAALSANPNDANALLGLGTVELYRNQTGPAEAHLRRALQLAPQLSLARARLDALGRRTGAPSDYRITFSPPGATSIPFAATDPVPTIRARIDGLPVTLAIDTGGPNIDLSESTVNKLHLSSKAAGQGVFAGGLRAPIRTLHIERFQAGSVVVRSISGGVMPGGLEGVDGVIGTGFLYHFLATIDYGHNALVLRPAGDSPTFERAAETSAMTSVPFWLAGDRIIVTQARVNVAPPALFVVDTGGPGIGVDLTEGSLKAAGIVPDAAHPQTMLGGGGPTRVLPFTAASVTLGTVTRRDLPGVYLPDAKPIQTMPFTIGGRISQEFFKKMSVTFDFRAMRLVLN